VPAVVAAEVRGQGLPAYGIVFPQRMDVTRTGLPALGASTI
jgi:hypothetical protein